MDAKTVLGGIGLVAALTLSGCQPPASPASQPMPALAIGTPLAHGKVLWKVESRRMDSYTITFKVPFDQMFYDYQFHCLNTKGCTMSGRPGAFLFTHKDTNSTVSFVAGRMTPEGTYSDSYPDECYAVLTVDKDVPAEGNKPVPKGSAKK